MCKRNTRYNLETWFLCILLCNNSTSIILESVATHPPPLDVRNNVKNKLDIRNVLLLCCA